MELKTAFDFDFKAKNIDDGTSESTVFVSHIDCNDDAIACSGNGFVKLYDMNNGKVVTFFGTGQKAMSDMQFANKHPHLLCASSSLNGVVAIYDIRSNNKQNSKSKSKRLCLLRSPNKQVHERALYSVAMDDHIIAAAGKHDIYLWDNRKLPGNGNSNSCYTLDSYHSDEVTKVRFNPFSTNSVDTHLLSVSEDTLLNQYDLSDVNKVCYNTYALEKELWNFGLFCHESNQFVYSLSNDESVIVQKLATDINQSDDEDDDKKIEDISDKTQFESQLLGGMTLVDCFYDSVQSKSLCLLSCNEQGKLRLSGLDIENHDVKVLSESMDGHQARIRCAKYVEKLSCIFTGGEDNKVSMWKFDPLNIKPQQIAHHESNKTKVVQMNDDILLSGYGATRSSSNASPDTAVKPKHFSPY